MSTVDLEKENAELRKALEEVRAQVSFQVLRIEREMQPSLSPFRKCDPVETLMVTYAGFAQMASTCDSALSGEPIALIKKRKRTA